MMSLLAGTRGLRSPLRAAVGRVVASSSARMFASQDAQPEALGFSSPGNSGTSEEMKETGRPHEVKDNEQATQRHHFSEKLRFNSTKFDNSEKIGSTTAAPMGGDTGSERAVGDLSMKLAKEDPVTNAGTDFDSNSCRDTVDGLAPEIDRGAAPADFGSREGGEGGPGEIVHGRVSGQQQTELKEEGVDDGGGGVKSGPAPESEGGGPVQGAQKGGGRGEREEKVGEASFGEETGPHNVGERHGMDYSR